MVTLPAILRHKGYRTIHSGKAHFGPVGSFGELPQNFGFDVNIAGCSYGQPGSYYGEDHFGFAKKGRERRAVPGLQKYHGQDIHLSEALTLEIKEAIRDAVEDEEPFFAYMSHYAVHTPFQSDERFAANYEHLDLKPNAKAFATLIEGMDKSLGDILDELDRLGVAEDTLVFFLGDNGSDAPLGDAHEIAWPAPLRGKKATHYEGGLRVPFIAAWAKGMNLPPCSSGLGFLPTDCPIKLGPCMTFSLRSLECRGFKRKRWWTGWICRLLWWVVCSIGDRISHAFPHQHRSNYFTSYRLGDWKAIYHYHEEGAGRYELFNLAEDRSESNNLAESRRGELRRMMRAMVKALVEADAQYPLATDGSGRTLDPEIPQAKNQ